MRPEIARLIEQGALPSSQSDILKIKKWQEALERIEPPVTDEEAVSLLRLFPNKDDHCFGLAWTLVHLVETAPNWPLQNHLDDTQNPWIARLRQAARLD